MKCKLNSHPGILLKTHIDNVFYNGMKFFNKNKRFQKFKELIKIALIFHDFGKATIFFQKYINNGIVSDLKAHAEISAYWGFFYCKEVLKLSSIDSLIVFLLIKKHHGNFLNFEDNFKPFFKKEQLMEMNSTINYAEMRYIIGNHTPAKILTAKNFEKFYKKYNDGSIADFLLDGINVDEKWFNNDYYFTINYLFSILISADKGEAIFKDTVEFKKSNVWNKVIITPPDNNSPINVLRNQMLKETLDTKIARTERIWLLNGPTGLGKTIAGFSKAIQIKKLFKLNKIHYCCPFTTITDQTEEVLAKILKANNIKNNFNTMMKCHHLTNPEKKEDDQRTLDELGFLYDMWTSECIISTDHQFFHTIFSGRNRALKKFHNLSNSVVILDEIQSIPHRYWKLINKTLKFIAKKLNIYFIIMTATMPLMFDEYKDLIDAEKYFKQLSRIHIIIDNENNWGVQKNLNQFVNIVLEDTNKTPDKSQLIILNTIGCALKTYLLLANRQTNKKVYYLSANLSQNVREKVLNEIKKDKNCILVSTQVVEVGVDIDFDIVYRDFCPLNSMFQSGGRCNRNSFNGKSVVKVFNLIDEKKRPYYQFVYEHILTAATWNVVSTYKYKFDESQFYEISQEYYKQVMEAMSNVQSDKLITNINKLEYFKAFDFRSEHSFNLIRQDPRKVALFFLFEEEAKQLKKELDSVYINNPKMNKYQVENEKGRILKKLNRYSITLDRRHLDPNEFDLTKEEQEIFWITDKKYYNDITGFIRYNPNHED